MVEFDLDKYVSLKLAVGMTGLSLTTLRNYADSGKIHSIRVPPANARLLLRNDVMNLASQRSALFAGELKRKRRRRKK